jgi:hypothetical protein
MTRTLDKFRTMLAKRAIVCSCDTCRASVYKAGELPATSPDDIGERLLGEFTGRVRGVVSRQLEAVASTLQEGGATGQALAQRAAVEMMQPKWGSMIEEAARPYVAEIVRIGGEAGLAVVPSPVAAFNAGAPNVQAWVESSVTRLAEDIRFGTVTRVSDLLGDSLDRGESIDDIARKLTSEGYDDLRAETIARTESARAYSQGNIEGWEQSGVVDRKAWSPNPGACEFCQAAAAKFGADEQAIPLRADFFSNGSEIVAASGKKMTIDYAAVNGPPLHPGCRCSLMPVLSD